jgi:ubiquinone/menaquinone biosynthesis C-methylase UbiE
MRQSKFTEADTEAFYNQEDSLYRSFWDREGSLHWGYFDQEADSSSEKFLQACQRWNEYMLEQSGITSDSCVLDVGCGNGNTAVWLATQTGCEVVGVDISSVRIGNAEALARQHPSLRLSFQKASATSLPFADGFFTHVWSQATLYHIHERELALREIQRVLKERGIFLFDDLVTPVEEIGETARNYVYNRLLFEPTFSLESYGQKLTQLGLMVFQVKDLSEHLKKSYELLSELAQKSYPDLSAAYEKMCSAIASGEVGWCFYLCEKVSDRLSWIYETTHIQSLRDKYNAWASIYDTELDKPYRCCPIQAVRALEKVQPTKNVSILDAGAGTGMVGEALVDLGYKNITAVDFSEAMLEVASKKQVYTALHQWNLEDAKLFCQEETFDAILAVGVFTFAHAHPTALRQLNRLLKTGGFFVLTVRVDYYNTSQSLQEVLKELAWSLISSQEFNIFETEPMYVQVFKKPFLATTKED